MLSISSCLMLMPHVSESSIRRCLEQKWHLLCKFQCIKKNTVGILHFITRILYLVNNNIKLLNLYFIYSCTKLYAYQGVKTAKSQCNLGKKKILSVSKSKLEVLEQFILYSILYYWLYTIFLTFYWLEWTHIHCSAGSSEKTSLLMSAEPF